MFGVSASGNMGGLHSSSVLDVAAESVDACVSVEASVVLVPEVGLAEAGRIVSGSVRANKWLVGPGTPAASHTWL